MEIWAELPSPAVSIWSSPATTIGGCTSIVGSAACIKGLDALTMGTVSVREFEGVGIGSKKHLLGSPLLTPH